MVDQIFLRGSVNSLTAPTQNIPLHLPPSFFKKRPFVYAEACALMAIRTRKKSDCGAGHRHSAQHTTVPPSAAGLQLAHASASVLLVRPTQGFGGFVRWP